MKIRLFARISIADTTILNAFAVAANNALKSSVREFKYPEALKSKHGAMCWKEHTHEIKEINRKILKAVSDRAGVYAILVAKKDEDWTLKYIGQTTSKGSKGRLTSHLVWRNKETKSGKYTGSKFDEIQYAVKSKEKIGLSFVELHPATLRHFIESYLIEKKQPEWNFHGTTARGQRKSSRNCSL